jgi:hypothetical protein
MLGERCTMWVLTALAALLHCTYCFPYLPACGALTRISSGCYELLVRRAQPASWAAVPEARQAALL